MRKFYPLLSVCFFILWQVAPLFSQVTPLGTGISMTDMSTLNSVITTGNVTIPASNDRLLVVSLVTKNNATVTSVIFNQTGGGTSTGILANAGNYMALGLQLSVYYIVVSGTAAISGIVTANTNIDSDFGIFVHAFANVDPANPIDAAANQFMVGNSNVSVPTQTDDMVIDLRVSNANLTLGLLGQVDLGPPLPMGMNQIRSTYRSAQGGTTELHNNQNSGHLITALNVKPKIVIPTMSQWGLLIFALLILNLSVVFLNKLSVGKVLN